MIRSSQRRVLFALILALTGGAGSAQNASVPPAQPPSVERLSSAQAQAFEAKLQKKYAAAQVRVYRVNGDLAVLLLKPAFYRPPHVLLDADTKLAPAAHDAKVAGLLQRYEEHFTGIAQEVLNTFGAAGVGKALQLQLSNDNPGGRELTVNVPVAYLKTLQSRPLDATRAGELKRELTRKFSPTAVKLSKTGGALIVQLQNPNFYRPPNVLEAGDLTVASKASAKTERLRRTYDAPLQDILRGAVQAFFEPDVQSYVLRVGRLSGGQWVYLDLTVPRSEAAQLRR
ncbi:hypothetical protein [Deinococcus peraridilitoris]|uniref:Uncharacterized protein n=1 Tax=Deinococcus peraridilitoris (strain DSM 19664 / LMG 22246 / CIP 109416 / KR-200) TaxID=937777 RepID=K9ZWD5_DEIPD|nr:hypothetical protein [Deinococcus peraridilitoris]AFZ65891.1 hypothetical protein Deipe_0290 [Deinococcus peraridilitoris DSM 19664]